MFLTKVSILPRKTFIGVSVNNMAQNSGKRPISMSQGIISHLRCHKHDGTFKSYKSLAVVQYIQKQVHAGISIKKASQQLGIPKSTATRWLRQLAISKLQDRNISKINSLLKNEQHLVNILTWCNDKGLPVTPQAIRVLGYQFAMIFGTRYSIKNCKKHSLSKDWHKTLRLRYILDFNYSNGKVKLSNINYQRKQLSTRITTANLSKVLSKNEIYILSITYHTVILANEGNKFRVIALTCCNLQGEFIKLALFCPELLKYVSASLSDILIISDLLHPLNEWFEIIFQKICVAPGKVMLIVCNYNKLWMDIKFLEKLFLNNVEVILVPLVLCDLINPVDRESNMHLKASCIKAFDNPNTSNTGVDMHCIATISSFIEANKSIAADSAFKLYLESCVLCKLFTC